MKFMGYSFSGQSKSILLTCDRRLQDICNEAITMINFSVICGYRDQADQNAAFAKGTSKVQFPNSKHNSNPSMAVDLQPYPLKKGMEDRQYYYLAGIIVGVAKKMNIPIRWGGNWECDGNIVDNKFNDLGHFEIKGE